MMLTYRLQTGQRKYRYRYQFPECLYSITNHIFLSVTQCVRFSFYTAGKTAGQRRSLHYKKKLSFISCSAVQSVRFSLSCFFLFPLSFAVSEPFSHCYLSIIFWKTFDWFFLIVLNSFRCFENSPINYYFSACQVYNIRRKYGQQVGLT